MFRAVSIQCVSMADTQCSYYIVWAHIKLQLVCQFIDKKVDE